ncbi:MAG TPA: VWA domain-containing protein [Phycisphaerales bacterium]|nr:VWA domain-containing protein [Phycisphaerales bacterium]
MTFLAPLPAIVAALVAVPALLVLYFLKLRRRPVRVGSTMLWAQAAEDIQANVPFRWLRPSLLLLLQLLILALLLLALARPALHAQGAMPGQVFIVLDRSASMRAADMPAGASRFEAATERARDAIERVAVASFQGEISVIACGASAEIVAGPTRSKGELLRALDALAPADEPGDLAAALRLVQALIGAEDPESAQAPRALVVVCSDGSTAAELPALPAEVRFARAAPKERIGDNLGFVAIAARRDAETPSLVRVFARLSSNLQEASTLPLTVTHAGEVLARQAVEVEPAAGGQPGETPVSLQVGMPGGGLLTLSIDRADALDADNTAALRIEPPRRPAVLLVRTEESESAGSGWLLTDVLRELNLSTLRLISSERLRELGADAYDGVDLAIFDAAPGNAVPPIPSLHFGDTPPLPAISSHPAEPAVQPILAWDRAHPLLRDVALDGVRVGRTALLDPAPEADPRDFTELARTARGVVLAVVEHDRVAHVVAGFDLVQSTWPMHYSFPIFLANAVESLPAGGSLAGGWAGRTGQPVVLPRPVEAAGAQLRDPRGGTRPAPAPAADGALSRLGMLDLAGIWRIGETEVPVNLLDARESSLEAPLSLPVPGAPAPASESTRAQSEPREIWPWLLIAAAALLTLEWVLFGLRVRI